MIAFGCIVTEPAAYRRYAEPGIARTREPDSQVLAFAAVGMIGRSYNLLLESAARHADLEALVIVHPHAELDDPGLLAAVRAAFAADSPPAVLGVAGAAGADVHGLAWWRGKVSVGGARQRHTAHGGGELPLYGWAAPGPAPAAVDVLDGFVLVLSAWAVHHVRFDEGLVLGHGYDVDFCRRVRAAGGGVATIDARVIEHRELELLEEPDLWIAAHIDLARRWPPETPPDWERRARRAEAEREVTRTVAYGRRLADDMRLAALQERIDALTATRSWRITRPLRELNRRRRARGAPDGGR